MLVRLGIKFAARQVGRTAVAHALRLLLVTSGDLLLKSLVFHTIVRAGGLFVGRIPYNPRLSVGENFDQFALEIGLGALVFGGFHQVGKVARLARLATNHTLRVVVRLPEDGGAFPLRWRRSASIPRTF